MNKRQKKKARKKICIPFADEMNLLTLNKIIMILYRNIAGTFIIGMNINHINPYLCITSR